jgi:DNA repair protein RecO (recombination protein O)
LKIVVRGQQLRPEADTRGNDRRIQRSAELGFGLDLSRCAATGETTDLVYVSPKSGHAVSAKAGEPYRDKLLRLPAFLLPDGAATRPSPPEALDGVRLTGYFLDQRVFAPRGREMPPARARFVDVLERMATIWREQNL